MIGNFGVGFNHIDINAAKEHGITVSNTPSVLTDCTADIAMSLLLMVARRVGQGERELRSDNWTGWRPTHLLGTKVTGKKLGVIGFGRIGQAVAKRAHFGFDMDIQYWDPYDIPADITKKFNEFHQKFLYFLSRYLLIYFSLQEYQLLPYPRNLHL